MKYVFWFLGIIIALVCVGFVYYYFFVQGKNRVENVTYGVSFNTPYAKELGLDWVEVYSAILDDLQVKYVRLAVHSPMISPQEGVWNFEELDTQIRMAEERGVKVVLAVGRRLPRWPECHVPLWLQTKSWEEQKMYYREYIKNTVERYKDSSAILYWQVENEPFLTVYASEHCGNNLDVEYLEEEIALVKSLDPAHPVLVTDSGNLGLWYGAYSRGDVFGTSVYVYLFNPTTGAIETILPPEAYALKKRLMGLIFGQKESLLIELSAEPWLNGPIAEADMQTQLERMSLERFKRVVEYAKNTGFDTQFLWGAEWWYWLKETQETPAFWEYAKELYAPQKIDSTE
jgi:Cellulase (glycosyl hydrolase family 5)